MNIQEKYDAWNKQLEIEFTKLFPNQDYVFDGVVDAEAYAANPVKVMFFNREPNAQDDSYDLPSEIKKSIRENRKILNSSNAFRQSCMYDLGLAACLMHRKFPYLTKKDFLTIVLPFQNDEIFNKNIMSAAFCNVKKVSGEGKIKNWNEIRAHYLKGIDIIFKQIKYFNPTIMFCGNIVDEVLDKLDVPENRFRWREKIDVRGTDMHFYVCAMELDSHVYPIVDLYHPSYAWLQNNTAYWFEILKGMQQVEKDNPGFWASHINKKCFEE